MSLAGGALGAGEVEGGWRYERGVDGPESREINKGIFPARSLIILAKRKNPRQ